MRKGGSIKGRLARWAISRLQKSRVLPFAMAALRRKYAGRGVGLAGGCCSGRGLRLTGSGVNLAGGRRRRRRRR